MRPRFLHRRPAVRARDGVTLIELLIVLVIMSGLLMMSVPRVDFARYRADGACQVLRTAIQMAQRTALTRQHDVLLSFDVNRGRLRTALDANDDGQMTGAERATWRSLPDGARFAAPPRALDGSTAGALRSGGLHTVDGMPTLVFRRDGAVSGGAEIYLVGARRLARDFRAVQVLQATGRTDWFRYTGSAWVPGGL